jgi:hypothetical protein
VPVNPPGQFVDTALDRAAPSGLGAARHIQTEDDLLALLLIHTWTLTTGRVLRSDVPPAQLSEDELIAFWADDYIAPAGAVPAGAVPAGAVPAGAVPAAGSPAPAAGSPAPAAGSPAPAAGSSPAPAGNATAGIGGGKESGGAQAFYP